MPTAVAMALSTVPVGELSSHDELRELKQRLGGCGDGSASPLFGPFDFDACCVGLICALIERGIARSDNGRPNVWQQGTSISILTCDATTDGLMRAAAKEIKLLEHFDPEAAAAQFEAASDGVKKLVNMTTLTGDVTTDTALRAAAKEIKLLEHSDPEAAAERFAAASKDVQILVNNLRDPAPPDWRCEHCQCKRDSTPQRRSGPSGPGTLCD